MKKRKYKNEDGLMLSKKTIKKKSMKTEPEILKKHLTLKAMTAPVILIAIGVQV
jgi:hypothetical protein